MKKWIVLFLGLSLSIVAEPSFVKYEEDYEEGYEEYEYLATQYANMTTEELKDLLVVKEEELKELELGLKDYFVWSASGASLGAGIKMSVSQYGKYLASSKTASSIISDSQNKKLARKYFKKGMKIPLGLILVGTQYGLYSWYDYSVSSEESEVLLLEIELIQSTLMSRVEL